MIDSYFFIPGDKPNYLNKINEVNADYFVLDLEDAVSINNKQLGFENIMALKVSRKMFLRIPFFDNVYSTKQIIDLIRKFAGQIVLPKINSIEDIKKIIAMSGTIELKMIVLVENPLSFVAVPEILKIFSSQIYAIGFGSHDFCSLTGIKHTLKYLTHYKQQLILFAKAYNVFYIDGVDLDLKDFEGFKNECLFAFEAGADGKFIIHPEQLKELNKVEFMTEEEINQLNFVYNKIKHISTDDIDVFKIDGKVYEKPHIARIKIIVDKLKEFKK